MATVISVIVQVAHGAKATALRYRWAVSAINGLTTVTFPLVVPKVTVIEFVPCPAVMVDPAGTVHV